MNELLKWTLGKLFFFRVIFIRNATFYNLKDNKSNVFLFVDVHET